MKRLFIYVLLLRTLQAWSQDANPCFEYRGMHLDVARHFFDKEVILRYIDTMSQHHINYFHWHLTDDQGWRIEIKQYPLLTETGAWRTEKNGTRYGGFYTQQEVKEIVQYAAQKNITIVPEIDLPGHSSAAIASYPFLSCTKGEKTVPNSWGIFRDILCPRDSTFTFLYAVMDEVCALFPSPYIHIGGDEVPKSAWKQSKDVSALMQKEKLNSYESVQHYIMSRIESYLQTKGRRCIMWGEALRGGVSDSTIIMSWRGRGAGIQAARKGLQVIMAPRFTCYFDYPATIQDKKPAWWMTYTPIKKVERFNPRCRVLNAQQNQNILGGEATLWTEYVNTEQQLWHQLLPRLEALGKALCKQ
ncbi:MAG: family 20 glycosylhydrolase [Bacteroidetes bacterium]|nr:family 20 glycosylhydrolase [Bacteroidota bacterium]